MMLAFVYKLERCCFIIAMRKYAGGRVTANLKTPDQNMTVA